MLVLDDDPATRALLQVLVDHDRDLVWLPPAPGGRDGVARAPDPGPDIVVCDVALRGGRAEAARLRARCPEAVICVLTDAAGVGAETALLADVSFAKSTVDVSAMFRELKGLCAARARPTPDQPRPDIVPVPHRTPAPTSDEHVVPDQEETTP